MLQRNVFLFKFYYFFWRFKPLEVLLIVYLSQVLKSYAMATAVYAIFNISYAVAKIPSGLISDKIGRKSVIIAANILMTMAFCLLALSGQIGVSWLLFAFALLWGCGEALSAGTIEAMIYETSQSLGRKDKFYTIYSKSMFFDQLGCAFGAFCAMAVTYFMPLQVVAWLSVFPPFMQLIVACFFVEPQVEKKAIAFSLGNIADAFGQFKKNKTLCLYALFDVYFSTLGDISHRLESAYFKLFTSNWVISLARVLKHFWGMMGFAFVARLNVFLKVKMFFSSIICNVFVRTLAIAFNNVCSPFIHMFINFFYATGITAKADIMQNEYLPEYRATSEAIIQFIKGIYMSVVMLLLGIIADMQGIYFVMILLVILRIIGLAVAYVLRKDLKI